MSDAAAVKTIEIWADTRGRAACRGDSCGATIEWAEVVKTGRRQCFDTPLVALRTRHDEATHRLIEIVDLSTNHWATCPSRAQFSGGRRGGKGSAPSRPK